MQQGRVQLDSDWNEQLDLQLYRRYTQTVDVIGPNGVPKKGNGFLIHTTDGTDLLIHAGRIYIGGLLCELNDTVSYFEQPYFPNPEIDGIIDAPDSPPDSPPESPVESPPDSPPEIDSEIPDGTYLVYLKAWQREVNYIDDPDIKEVALGGPDTTTRLQNVWQVRLFSTDIPGLNCDTDIPEWNDFIAQPTGTLNVQTIQVPASNGSCILPSSDGYQGLENQLYRIEIQSGGDMADTTFKWSRHNASVETKILKIDGAVLTVEEVNKDSILGFTAGQWVEIVDDESSLKGTPQDLIEIDTIDPASNTITLKSSNIPNKNGENLKLRAWDQSSASAEADGLDVVAGWMNIEDGIQVEFSAGTYRAGDYWLIAARTAIAEVEWPMTDDPVPVPIAQPPVGLDMHYCKLAVLEVMNGDMTILDDCRPLFPSLTEICAEDICYDSSNCDNALNATNVQEAIDLLCAANDLRLHNKLLHGYGVICGLKVYCGPVREQVFITKGYGLDCEGNIIQLKKSRTTYDVVAQAQNQKLLDNTGSAKVCLRIERNGSDEPVFAIEPYVEKSYWETILQGGVWEKFYKECIETLIEFVMDQLPIPLDDKPPVSIKQRRLTAFINLFIQVLNPTNGAYVFLSGQRDIGRKDQSCGTGSDEGVYDDKLLYCFYKELRNLIASKTYCAMFDDDEPFPDYNIDPGLGTIYGPSLKAHYNLKVNERNQMAYTSGFDSKIYVYDLKSRELVHSVDFPISAGIQVRDMAFSPERDIIYAVGLMDEKDSVFAVGDIKGDGSISWRPTSKDCGNLFVRLAVMPNGTVLAIAKNKGLYSITDIGTNGFTKKLLEEFNATGMLKVTPDGSMAFAAENNSVEIGSPTDDFDNIVQLTLAAGDATIFARYPLNGQDFENDIFFHEKEQSLFASGTEGSKRVLMRVDLASEIPGITLINLDNNVGSVRLDRYQPETTGIDYLLISCSDLYKVMRMDLSNNEIDERWRLPTQFFPIAIEIDEKENKGYVLNYFVNTITDMDLTMAFHDAPAPDYTMEPPYNISDYRERVIKAYSDLLSHFVQSLKDCFCDQYLIDCHECDEDDQVYLGVIEIEGERVHRICNFTKRQYVKSFNTYGYWLSTVPILPILKKSFKDFCQTLINP